MTDKTDSNRNPLQRKGKKNMSKEERNKNKNKKGENARLCPDSPPSHITIKNVLALPGVLYTACFYLRCNFSFSFMAHLRGMQYNLGGSK